MLVSPLSPPSGSLCFFSMSHCLWFYLFYLAFNSYPLFFCLSTSIINSLSHFLLLPFKVIHTYHCNLNASKIIDMYLSHFPFPVLCIWLSTHFVTCSPLCMLMINFHSQFLISHLFLDGGLLQTYCSHHWFAITLFSFVLVMLHF